MKIAVGFFDGVHLGHRAILDGVDAAVTFKRHPLELLAPERAPRLLMSAPDRIAAIRAAGVREVAALDFTPEFAAMEPERFAEYLRGAPGRFKAAGGVRDDGTLTLRCGGNWRFGRGGRGDAALLGRLGFNVEVVPFRTVEGERISSTRIRSAIAAGDIALANAMLGRPWTMRGVVFAGKGLGGSLGCPTVNIKTGADGEAARLAEPPRGVYAVEAGGVRGVANFGTAPTMGDAAWREPVMEVHFLGPVPSEAKSGGELTVSILRFLRPECRFESISALKAQISADCAAAFSAD